MTYRIFTLLILSCFWICTYGQDWKTLEKNNYVIEYPATWEMNEPGMMGALFTLLSPLETANDVFRENVNLIEQDLAGMNMDLDQYTEISISQIKALITNATIKTSEKIDDYQKVIFDGDQGQFKLTFEQYYRVKDDKAYVITFTAERIEFSDYQEIGEKILNTFTLK